MLRTVAVACQDITGGMVSQEETGESGKVLIPFCKLERTSVRDVMDA